MEQTTDTTPGTAVATTNAPPAVAPASTQALTRLEAGAVALPEASTLATFADQMQGLEETLDFDRIKIASGDVRAFQIPTGDGDEVEILPQLEGIIIYDHPSSVTYFDSKEERAAKGIEGNRPDFWSPDGVTQVVPPEALEEARKRGLPEPSRVLKDCPYNQWGSDPKGGRGKWTKNQHRVYLLRPGHMLPELITLPPTSIQPFGKWKGKRILLGGFGHTANVLARITLASETNGAGTTYSECRFAVAAVLDPADAAKAFALGEQLQPLFHKHASDVSTLDEGVVVVEDTGTFGGTAPATDLDAAFAAAPSGGDGFVSAADAVAQAGVGEAPPQAANEVF